LQSIDPGLLKQEREDGADSAFTVELSPIPAYGTKRLELEYTEALPVENLESYYSFPLKPSEYGTQTAGHLEIRLEISSGFPMTDLNLKAKSYPLTFIDNTPLHKSAAYDALNVDLNEDLAFGYGLAVPHTAMQFLAYRAPERITADELRDPALAEREPDGYFEAGRTSITDPPPPPPP